MIFSVSSIGFPSHQGRATNLLRTVQTFPHRGQTIARGDVNLRVRTESETELRLVCIAVQWQLCVEKPATRGV